MQIKEMATVSNSNAKEFYDQLSRDVGRLQLDGQEVEIQYSVNTGQHIEGGVLLSISYRKKRYKIN